MFAPALAVNHHPVPNPPTDLDLVRRCAAGDIDAFETIYRKYAARMKSIAFNHLGNISDAEDAVQETFLKIHRAASGFTAEAAFSTWLYRIEIGRAHV